MTSVSKWLTYPEVMAITGLSRTTIWRLTSENELFPNTIKIGEATRFDADDLSTWMELQKEAAA
ncbi:MAG: helix-turn-helix domain-containing protein [Rhizobiaceae bacterium]